MGTVVSTPVVECHCAVKELVIFSVSKNEDKFMLSIQASAPCVLQFLM